MYTATAKQTPSLKVFLVDDSRIVIERLSAMLKDLENISVVGHAYNFDSALTSIEEQKPDAVILDLYLADDTPDRNGMYLLATLRETYAHMPIIMLTNLSSPQYHHKCIALGANHFLDKTNDFEKIPGIIQTLVQTKSS